MVQLSDEKLSEFGLSRDTSRKVIVCINGLPPVVWGLSDFLHDQRAGIQIGIRASLGIFDHWNSVLRGNVVHIIDFKTIEGLVFDEYARENDR